MTDNRSLILDCAIELFALRGYDAVGVQEVADAAGLKKPTLYHYFGSKSGLLATLLTEKFSPLFMELEETATSQIDVFGGLTAIATVYFQFAQSHPRLYRLNLSMWFSPPESDAFKAVATLNHRQQAILESFFLRAAEMHGNMKGRHQTYAATFLGMLNTYIALGLNNYASLDSEMTRKAVHQFMHGIFS